MYICIYVHTVRERERDSNIMESYEVRVTASLGPPPCHGALSLSLYIYIYTSSCYHLKPICGLSEVNTFSLGSDESSWCAAMIYHDESSWCIMMIYHGESSWYILMTHNEDSSWCVKLIHHDGSSCCIMITHHHESSWYIMMILYILKLITYFTHSLT